MAHCLFLSVSITYICWNPSLFHFTIPTVQLQSAAPSFFSHIWTPSKRCRLPTHQNCVKAVSHLVGIRLRSSRVLSIHSPLCVPVYVIFVCAVLETKMLSDIYQRLYSIFYLYLKVDNMKRQANECCDILYVFQKYLLMSYYCDVWQWWWLHEMLIISYCM